MPPGVLPLVPHHHIHHWYYCYDVQSLHLRFPVSVVGFTLQAIVKYFCLTQFLVIPSMCLVFFFFIISLLCSYWIRFDFVLTNNTRIFLLFASHADHDSVSTSILVKRLPKTTSPKKNSVEIYMYLWIDIFSCSHIFHQLFHFTREQ